MPSFYAPDRFLTNIDSLIRRLSAVTKHRNEEIQRVGMRSIEVPDLYPGTESDCRDAVCLATWFATLPAITLRCAVWRSSVGLTACS